MPHPERSRFRLLSRAAPALRKLGQTARKSARGLAILAALVCMLYLLQKYLPVQEWLRSGAETYRGLGALGVLLFVATYAGLVLVLAPAPGLSLMAGALYGLGQGYLVAAGSLLLSALVVYLLAGVLMRRRAAQWVSKYPAFRAVRSAGGEEPVRSLFALHTSPIFPVTVANTMLTLSGMRPWTYLLGAWLGMLPGTLFYVYIGVLGGGLALDTQGLAARDFWIFGTARVALWILGILGTIQFGLLVKRHAAKTHTASSLDEPAEAA